MSAPVAEPITIYSSTGSPKVHPVAESLRLYRLSVSADKAPGGGSRRLLTSLFRYFSWIAAAAVVYVLLDFSIDIRPPAVQSSYYFEISPMASDEVRIVRQDNLSILIIRRSAETRAALLQASAELQDSESSDSHQPGYARNPLRSRNAEYFVSYAIGTDLGCPLEPGIDRLQEVCGKATYDFAGRALSGTSEFSNLSIPDYQFSDDYSRLTINP